MPTFKKLLVANGLVAAMALSAVGAALPSGASGYPTTVASQQLALQVATTPFSVNSHMNVQAKRASYRKTALEAAAKRVASIYVIGYTDNTCGGSCVRISAERARGVAGALTASLHASGDFTTVVKAFGRGAANPIASNKSAAGRQANNRVVIVYG